MKKFFYLFVAALALAACNENEPNIHYPEGAIHGLFSVSATQQVAFSRGNLQYNTKMSLYLFATNQWDIIGTDNVSDGWPGSVIDLFGWGTGTNPTNFSTMNADYPTFTDWGVKGILYGGSTANMWRTLTKDEWVYLFFGRPDADKLFSVGIINGVKGVILLPDNWKGNKFTDPAKSLNNYGTYYATDKGDMFYFHTYDGEAWTAMEKAGAVFLPCAGIRLGSNAPTLSTSIYWSATPFGETQAYDFLISSNSLEPQRYDARYAGLAVRLVKDLTKEDISPDPNRPKAPTGLTVQKVEREQGNGWIDHFNLSWEPVEGAKTYKVYRTLKLYGTREHEANHVIATVTETNFQDNLFDSNDWDNKNMMYFIYTVTAVSSNGSESDPSEEVSAVWERGV